MIYLLLAYLFFVVYVKIHLIHRYKLKDGSYAYYINRYRDWVLFGKKPSKRSMTLWLPFIGVFAWMHIQDPESFSRRIRHEWKGHGPQWKRYFYIGFPFVYFKHQLELEAEAYVQDVYWFIENGDSREFALDWCAEKLSEDYGGDDGTKEHCRKVLEEKFNN